MTKPKYTLLIIMLIFSSFNTLATININIVSDQFPPLQSKADNGLISGYVHMYMKEVIRRVSRKKDLKVASYRFVPWKRAQMEAKLYPNTLFFSLSRTKERENFYHWLGEVSIYKQFFYRLRKNPINIYSIESLIGSNYQISVQNGGAVLNYLNNIGFKGKDNLKYYTHYQQGIKMLYRERVDLIPLNELTARVSACNLGFDGSKLKPHIQIKALAKPLWAVFSKGTSPSLVKLFREEMINIKNEGLFEEYYNGVMNRWNTQQCG